MREALIGFSQTNRSAGRKAPSVVGKSERKAGSVPCTTCTVSRLT